MSELKDMRLFEFARAEANRLELKTQNALSSIALPPRIYQYTKIDAAINILASNEFWLTDSRHMNDKTEFKHSQDILRERLSVHPLLQSTLAKTKLLPFLESAMAHDHCPNVFISSFSGVGDLKSQWYEYAESMKGCALRLDTPSIKKDIEAARFIAFGQDGLISPRIMCLPVIYDDFKKRELVDELLNDWLPPISLLFEENALHGPIREIFLPPFCGNVYQSLSRLKNSTLHEEHEVRLTLTLLSTVRAQTAGTAGMRVPFLRPPDHPNPRPMMTLKRLNRSIHPNRPVFHISRMKDMIAPIGISGIQMGPLADEGSQVRLLKAVEQAGLSSVEFSQSKIPYRKG